MDAIQLFHYLVIIHPIDGLMVGSLPGHIMDHHPLTHCLLYSMICLFGHPLWVPKLINHFKWSGKIQYLLLIWRTIFVILFLFFCCIIGSDRHVTIVFDSAVSKCTIMSCSFPMGKACIFQFELLLQSLSHSLLLSPQL